MTRRGLLIPIVTALLGSFTTALPAHAATTLPNAQGVQIGPTLLNLSVAPGQATTFSVNVMNVTGKTVTFTSAVNNFTAKDETGTPQINFDDSLPASISVKSWLSPVAPFTLAPYQSRTVTVSIRPPANAEAGGHYGVLRFSGVDAGSGQDGVSVVASAGTLLLLKVDGDILEHLTGDTFTTTDKKGDHHGIFESAPVTFETRLKNDGTIHLSPHGTIAVTDAFGRPVTTLPVNEGGGFILPHSTRRFDPSFDKSLLFGRYTATLSVGYGTTGGALERTISFWVIPYRLIASGLAILALLVFGIRFALRRYAARILANAKKTKE